MIASSLPLERTERCTLTGRLKSRVLLIDDDEAYTFLCKRHLRADESFEYTVSSASTVNQALTICRNELFDCIVIDYRLPDRTGTEVINLLREQLEDAMPPTIVLTADGGEEAAIEAVRSGASDFLAKRNVTRESLCRVVRNAVEKGMLRQSLTCRVHELEAANDLLVKRNDEIQRFYHTVSHEVKTPLTAIQEFVSIVFDGLAGPVQDEQKTILNYALESCSQICSHFDDLLELSRFETGKMTVDMTPSSIHAVFDHCIVASTPAAIAKGISLKSDNPARMPLVMMQSNRIMQVISNLINNAIKFTDAGGAVTLECNVIEEGCRLRLCVRDTGCGIPAGDTSKVFERLFQVTQGSDQQDSGGMGLGLSIASEIVSLHGSTIELDSELGVGSAFSFTLACCPDEVPAAP
ncbi:MAG: hybrid sensor histidine kinase/response regulator [Granulosicoccus sp.]|nr:hybrid sensor histidine kinase/response regulator [Granulosicoccus sp.]